MFVKHFKSGRGGIKYVRSKAHVAISGDYYHMLQYERECTFKQAVCSGALCFEEKFDDPTKIREVIASCERNLLFSGLDPSRFARMWTLHHEPGERVALHFNIIRQDLVTGKQYNPYFHAADMPRKEAWQDACNAKYELSSPKDPEKTRTFAIDSRNPRPIRELKRDLGAHLEECIARGKIQSFEHLKNELQHLGLSIQREGKGYLSVSTPSHQKNIRLKGGIYDKGQFDQLIEGAPQLGNPKRLNTGRGREAEYREAMERLLPRVEKAANRNRERYPSSGKVVAQVLSDLGVRDEPTARADLERLCLVSRGEDSGVTSRDHDLESKQGADNPRAESLGRETSSSGRQSKSTSELRSDFRRGTAIRSDEPIRRLQTEDLLQQKPSDPRLSTRPTQIIDHEYRGPVRRTAGAVQTAISRLERAIKRLRGACERRLFTHRIQKFREHLNRGHSGVLPRLSLHSTGVSNQIERGPASLRELAARGTRNRTRGTRSDKEKDLSNQQSVQQSGVTSKLR